MYILREKELRGDLLEVPYIAFVSLIGKLYTNWGGWKHVHMTTGYASRKPSVTFFFFFILL